MIFVALQFLKREVHIPLTMTKKVSELIDFPPTLKIYAERTASSSDLFAEVQVIGLDRECCFKRIPVISKTIKHYFMFSI